jgi:hypothetical protein
MPACLCLRTLNWNLMSASGVLRKWFALSMFGWPDAAGCCASARLTGAVAPIAETAASVPRIIAVAVVGLFAFAAIFGLGALMVSQGV